MTLLDCNAVNGAGLLSLKNKTGKNELAVSTENETETSLKRENGATTQRIAMRYVSTKRKRKSGIELPLMNEAGSGESETANAEEKSP